MPGRCRGPASMGPQHIEVLAIYRDLIYIGGQQPTRGASSSKGQHVHPTRLLIVRCILSGCMCVCPGPAGMGL